MGHEFLHQTIFSDEFLSGCFSLLLSPKNQRKIGFNQCDLMLQIVRPQCSCALAYLKE